MSKVLRLQKTQVTLQLNTYQPLHTSHTRNTSTSASRPSLNKLKHPKDTIQTMVRQYLTGPRTEHTHNIAATNDNHPHKGWPHAPLHCRSCLRPAIKLNKKQTRDLNENVRDNDTNTGIGSLKQEKQRLTYSLNLAFLTPT